jgi:hypothetical protein
MSRGSATFRQAALTRAVRGMVAAGVDVARLRVKIDKAGTIDITVRSEGEAAGTVPGAERNPWDEVLVNGASSEKHA